jgi:hypothetical protein
VVVPGGALLAPEYIVLEPGENTLAGLLHKLNAVDA